MLVYVTFAIIPTRTRQIFDLSSYVRAKLRHGCSVHVVHGRRRVDSGGTAPNGTNCLPAISLDDNFDNALGGGGGGLSSKAARGAGNVRGRATSVNLGIG